MKNILGIDLGSNSIGWSVLRNNNDNEIDDILSGSRIIPMDAAILGDFERGNSQSQTAERTFYRGTRRLRERHLLRRERLHRVLNILNFLPVHYSESIGWDKSCNKTFGKFLPNSEPKPIWAHY